jgi:putative acetyltransferase
MIAEKEAMAVQPNTEVKMPPGFSVRRAANDDIAAVRAILLCVRSEYGVLGEIGANDADLDDLEVNYFRGGGCFEVVEDGTRRIVGCAGLLPLNPCRAELCKMYIEKSARGLGLGRRLLQDLLAAARSSGFREVWLETNSVLTEAITLYKKYGFQSIAADHLGPRCDTAYLLRLSGSADP